MDISSRWFAAKVVLLRPLINEKEAKIGPFKNRLNVTKTRNKRMGNGLSYFNNHPQLSFLVLTDVLLFSSFSHYNSIFN